MVKWSLTGKSRRNLGRNLLHCHFIHQNVMSTGIKPKASRWGASIWPPALWHDLILHLRIRRNLIRLPLWRLYKQINLYVNNIRNVNFNPYRSQWLHGLRRRSAAPRRLRMWVRIPPGAWTFVYCECCVCCQAEVSATIWSLLQRSPTDWCVVMCDLETSSMRRPWRTGGLLRQKQTNKFQYTIVNPAIYLKA